MHILKVMRDSERLIKISHYRDKVTYLSGDNKKRMIVQHQNIQVHKLIRNSWDLDKVIVWYRVCVHLYIP